MSFGHDADITSSENFRGRMMEIIIITFISHSLFPSFYLAWYGRASTLDSFTQTSIL